MAVSRQATRQAHQLLPVQQRLSQLGLQPAQSRSTALFDLATQLPAAVLARMLGIHIGVAVAWQGASSGDWTGYAAQVSRRLHQQGASVDETH